MFPTLSKPARAIRHAQALISSVTAATPSDNEAVERWLLSSNVPIAEASADGRVLVTDEGFVTMAVVPALRIEIGSVAAMPGVDHRGVRGWLVIGLSGRAFHSRAATAHAAIAEGRTHVERALRLEQHFGSKAQMHAAVARSGFWQWSKFEDAHAAGLCQWGIESFLRRFGLWHLAHAAGGLPKAVLWAGGGYPRRVIAATVMRRQRDEHAFAFSMDDDFHAPPTERGSGA